MLELELDMEIKKDLNICLTPENHLIIISLFGFSIKMTIGCQMGIGRPYGADPGSQSLCEKTQFL